MNPFPTPEIRRVALESVALSVKVMHSDVKVCRQTNCIQELNQYRIRLSFRELLTHRRSRL